ncbi:unnamed protein product [Pleuronectes platessa]|uniref:Uncharacterized protein n=1 Tax=Pleuronectes platessa TaxID=8262 RepID=A0A9N7ZBX8_PLEPL|nr:unnamed protein product [Pleuronectes platessa]
MRGRADTTTKRNHMLGNMVMSVRVLIPSISSVLLLHSHPRAHAPPSPHLASQLETAREVLPVETLVCSHRAVLGFAPHCSSTRPLRRAAPPRSLHRLLAVVSVRNSVVSVRNTDTRMVMVSRLRTSRRARSL